MKFLMGKKKLLCRKVCAALSCLAVLLALVAAPAEVFADGEPFVMLDIVVYYNDSEANCFDFVVGEQVKVTGPGTYTLTFDCATALQFAQKDAGVTGLNNLGSIYLVDDKVFNTVTVDSIVKSFDFTYDSIEIDGTAVELKNHDERSGLKSRGEIDTNGPINAWEDCQLADGTYQVGEDFSLNFVGFENPQVIKITFTVTNMEFKETPTKEAEETTEEETTEEQTTEEEKETVSDETTSEANETSAEAESTAAAASNEDDKDGNNTLKVALVVVFVVALIAVIVVVIKKLKK